MVLHGLVAQRLAQGTHNPWVLGSNPGRPTYVPVSEPSPRGFGFFCMRWILYACRAPSWNWLDFQNKKKSPCNLFRCIDIIIFVAWGRSSAGRALDWQSRGQGFDPPRLHPRIFKNQKFASGSFLFEQSVGQTVYAISQKSSCMDLSILVY